MYCNKHKVYAICGPIMWEHDTPVALKKAIADTRCFTSMERLFEYRDRHVNYGALKLDSERAARNRKELLPVMVSDAFLMYDPDLSVMFAYSSNSGSHSLLYLDQLLLSLDRMMAEDDLSETDPHRHHQPEYQALHHHLIQVNSIGGSQSPETYIDACRMFNQATAHHIGSIQKRAAILSRLPITAALETRDCAWQTPEALRWSILLSARSMMWKNLHHQDESQTPFRALHDALLYLRLYHEKYNPSVDVERLCLCLIRIFVLCVPKFILRMRAQSAEGDEVEALVVLWYKPIMEHLWALCSTSDSDILHIFHELRWGELSQCSTRRHRSWHIDHTTIDTHQLLSFPTLSAAEKEHTVAAWHSNHLVALKEVVQRMPRPCKKNQTCEDRHIESKPPVSYTHHFGCQMCNEEILDSHNYRLYKCASGCHIRYHQSCLRNTTVTTEHEQCIICGSSYLYWEFYRETNWIKQELLSLPALPSTSSINEHIPTVPTTPIISPETPDSTTTNEIKVKLSPTEYARHRANEIKHNDLRVLQKQPQSWNEEKCLELIQTISTNELQNSKVSTAAPTENMPHPALELERKKNSKQKQIKGSLAQLDDLLSAAVMIH